MKPIPLSSLPRHLQDQIYATPLATKLPDPIPKQDAILPPLGAAQDEGGGPRRLRVRITRRGTKLLDVDNLYGSVKWLCDALRYKNLIPEDNPQAIQLEVTQEQVKRGKTGTLIEIEPL